MKLKILQIIDIKGWAIDHLNQAIIDYNPHIEFKVMAIHPKHVEGYIDDLVKALKEFKPHLIHYQYWNNCNQLFKICPALREYPSVLSHHNVKEILNGDWTSINRICTTTKESAEILAKEYGGNNVSQVPYGIDLEDYEYNKDYKPEKNLIGYVGRIENWKRLDILAKVAKEIGVKVLVMGAMGKPDYYNSIEKDNLIFDLKCDHKKLKENYKRMACFVNNSRQGRESGTLPLLEAMAMGVPVVTTRTGMAQDIVRNRINALVTLDDCSNLAENIKSILDSKETAENLRKNAWVTIREYPIQKFARKYARIYREVIFDNENSVSVIIPTFNRADKLKELIKGYELQTYKNFELLICDDNSTDDTKKVVEELKKECNLTIKYLNTNKKDDTYNLAGARNLGIIEAEGKWLMFCDDRLLPDPKAISEFIKVITNRDGKNWLYGNKGTGKLNFVENFSFVKKVDITDIGMFNCMIKKYGGMTQDVRARWERNNGRFKFIDNAKAKEIISSKAKNKRQEIAEMKYQIYKTLIEPNEQTIFNKTRASSKDI